MKVYIGYDEREPQAARVAYLSLSQVSKGQRPPVEFLHLPKLRDHGFMWRTFDRRGGQGYDLTGNATFSTEFKFTRFLVPMHWRVIWPSAWGSTNGGTGRTTPCPSPHSSPRPTPGWRSP